MPIRICALRYPTKTSRISAGRPEHTTSCKLRHTDGGSPMYRHTGTLIAALAIGLAVSTLHAGSAPTQRPQTTFDVMEKTIPQLQDAMAAGTITSRELVEIYLARIAAYDKQGPALNTMVALNPQA